MDPKRSGAGTPYRPEIASAYQAGTMPQGIANLGKGWYYGDFPPDAVEYFHITTMNRTLGGSIPIVDNTEYSIVGDAPIFTSVSGLVYVTTDFQFLVFRQDAGGGGMVLVGAADVAYNFTFKFLVDGIQPRFDIRTLYTSFGVSAAATRAGFPFVGVRPGPQVQSAMYGVQIPILDTQRVDATVFVEQLPLYGVSFGFTFSGLRMPRDVYERVRAKI